MKQTPLAGKLHSEIKCRMRDVNHEELVTGVSHLFGALTLTLRGYTLQLWLFGVYKALLSELTTHKVYQRAI